MRFYFSKEIKTELEGHRHNLTESVLTVMMDWAYDEDPIVCKRLNIIAKIYNSIIYKRLNIRCIEILLVEKLIPIINLKRELIMNQIITDDSEIHTNRCIVDKSHPILCIGKIQKCCVCSFYIKLR